MGRLQKIRRIELVGGLRALAEVETRVVRLDSVAARLEALVADLPHAAAVAERKAATVAREALDRARRSVADRQTNETQLRIAAAEAAQRLKARVDIVARLMADPS
ncbi:hypothetical protein [Glacieibacterium sp.]|uniref:hypothetical protein n=1 Tax=Glacieibacterium sp. TaxID=2860237 RepID=UPI003AFF9DEE